MNICKFEVSDLQPLEQAVREQQAQETIFQNQYSRAREFLGQVEKRQESRAQEIEAMLAELDSEEASLRKQVREDTSRRAVARINGQKLPESTCEAGARLAAIPDQRTALLALSRVKEMTTAEKEEWDSIHSELSDSADSASEWGKTVIALLLQWSRFFEDGYKKAALSADNRSLDTLLQKAYALNSHPAEDEHEEE